MLYTGFVILLYTHLGCITIPFAFYYYFSAVITPPVCRCLTVLPLPFNALPVAFCRRDVLPFHIPFTCHHTLFSFRICTLPLPQVLPLYGDYVCYRCWLLPAPFLPAVTYRMPPLPLPFTLNARVPYYYLYRSPLYYPTRILPTCWWFTPLPFVLR